MIEFLVEGVGEVVAEVGAEVLVALLSDADDVVEVGGNARLPYRPSSSS